MPEYINWTPELVTRFWDGFAKTELVDIAFGKLAGPSFIKLIETYIPEKCSTLDFACGNGEFIECLLDKGYSATGFEQSVNRRDALVERLSSRANFRGVVDYQCAEKFDAVIAMEVIEHILEPDFDSTLSKLADFVKPGGVLVISTPNNENLKYAKVYCPISNMLFHPWQHVRSFTEDRVEAIFSDLGFRRRLLCAVDFSSDAGVYEKVKAYESVLAEIEVAQRDFEKLVMELTSQVSESNSFGARFNIFSWLKIRADMKTKIAKVRSESSRLTQLAEQGTFLCSSFSIGYPTADQPKINKGFDAVIGRGTTIVYVGQKCVG